MRVLQINAVPNGSTGRLALAIHKKANENNAESRFIYTSGQTDEEGAVKIGTLFDQKLHALLSRLTGLQGYWSRRQTKKIIDYISDFSPDAVHIHNLHANNINIRMILSFLAKHKIAVCVTLHDCFFFTGHCAYYTDIGCFRWQDACGKCPAMKQYNRSLLFDTSKKALADKKKYFDIIDNLAIIGVSKWIANEAEKSILKNAKLIDYIYNWVDFDVFHPIDSIKNNEHDKKFVIMGVSESWSESKGIYGFIEIAKRLEHDEEIVLVGKCSIELPEQIRLIPRTENREKLAELYSQADVFVTLSKQETFGLVTAEALSCGTPVVVFNNTASPELVGEGCGYICPDGDIDAVIRNIRIIKENGKGKYSEKCVEFSHQMFDDKKNIEKYYNVYKKITEE
ncbi:MAG: glycosyltransferase [Eubacteriales bacterium]